MESAAGPNLENEKETKQIFAAVTLCFFFSGTTGLIYEVLWTRILGLVFGHTVFAITTVLAAFMAGLGLGSFLFGGVADRTARPLRLYGLLEAGIGVYALITPFLFARAQDVYVPLHRVFGLSFLSFSLLQFLLVFSILLVPTTLMGATLPVLSRFFVGSLAVVGKQVGRLYALNTFGAVLGTYAAGFHLIPTLGVRTTLLLAAIANLGIGVLVIASIATSISWRLRLWSRTSRPADSDDPNRQGLPPARQTFRIRRVAHHHRPGDIRGCLDDVRGRLDQGALAGDRKLHLRV